MPSTPAMTTGMMFRITSWGFITPMEEMPTPDFAVPYAAPMSVHQDNGVRSVLVQPSTQNLLAKQRAAVTPMNPKKGAEVGQVSKVGVLIVKY